MMRPDPENHAQERADCFIATGTALTIAALAGAGTSIYGANKAASGANHAADLQSRASQDALAYQRGESTRDQANFEATQHANYDQWAAREGRIGQLGDLLGMAPRNIPAYRSTSSGSPGSAPMGGKPGAEAFIAQYQASHPVSEGVQPLYQALKAAGYNVSPYMYGNTPSNNEITLNGQKWKLLGGEGSPAAYWYKPGTYDGGGYRGTAASLLG